MQAMLAAGGDVWVGDETTLREFPPLRAAWAPRGTQAVVEISGRNARRVLLGALNVTTGETVQLVRERTRTADVLAGLVPLTALRPDIPKWLLWDNAPPHHPRAIRDLAATVGIELVFLPFRSPELNPCKDLWRHLKAIVAANRAYPSVNALAGHALTWLDALTPDEIRRLTGLCSYKFDWLLT